MTDTTPTLPNFIADVNRWSLSRPPEWFLKRLYDFDDRLVIVPSRVKIKGEPPGYLLCIRRKYSAGLGDVAMLDNKHPDTNMCYAHGLLPIAPLRFKSRLQVFTKKCCDSLIADLKARDTWTITGGPGGDPDRVWKQVEYAEELQERRDHRNLRDMFYHRARDAYRSLKARTGQRNKRATDYFGRARRSQTTTTQSPAHTPAPPVEQRVVLTDAL